MQISEQWLRTFVDPAVDTAALAARLTMAGLEVKAIEHLNPAFTGVVVGEVLEAAPHPDADKLTVCTVADGRDRHTVVCGAPNVRAGMKSAFAPPGALLPGAFEIREAQLRGVVSSGMLCSAAELGLGDDAGGIMALPAAAAPGAPLAELLGLPDAVLDLDLTPNRGDCLSMKGVARELGVLSDQAVAYPECPAVPARTDAAFPVRLEDTGGCPRYLGRVISGVDLTRPTPLWMAERLRRSGLRPVDPIVDVTNYVLLELGQPMHAFDLAELDAGIEVRRARPGETLTLLDGAPRALDEQTLLIADASGPIALAGVMGGERSGIRASTRDVFLECAFFAPLAVAGTARRYGLVTDAAQRYERGVDHDLQRAALERATALLLTIVGGEAGPVTEAVAEEALPVRAEVSLRQARLDHVVGAAVAPAVVDRVFDRLGLATLSRQSDPEQGVVWTVRAPSHRFDLELEADLIEEVCRIHGYEQVPTRLPATPLELRSVPRERLPARRVKTLLVDLGYQEVITYSFVDPTLADLLDPDVESLTLVNPMSVEQSAMRTNLLPGLLQALAGNVSRQQSRARLFELGRCFRPGDPLEQPWVLGGCLWGERLPEGWTQAGEGVDFYDLKGDVERLLALGGAGDVRFEPAEDAVLHPGQSARVVRDERLIGRLGRLHPELEDRLDLRGPVFVFELDAESVGARHHPAHRPVSRHPSVRRDLSLVLAEDVSAAAVEAVVRDAAGPRLREFLVFDVYRGEGLGERERSLAVGLRFQEAERTLTDADVNDLMAQVVEALGRRLGARQR